MQKFTLNKAVSIDDPATACEFLANHTGLSKSRIKDAMTKGAVWLKKTKGKQDRIRRVPRTTEQMLPARERHQAGQHADPR